MVRSPVISGRQLRGAPVCSVGNKSNWRSVPASPSALSAPWNPSRNKSARAPRPFHRSSRSWRRRAFSFSMTKGRACASARGSFIPSSNESEQRRLEPHERTPITSDVLSACSTRLQGRSNSWAKSLLPTISACRQTTLVGYVGGTLGEIDSEGHRAAETKLDAHPESFQLEKKKPPAFMSTFPNHTRSRSLIGTNI